MESKVWTLYLYFYNERSVPTTPLYKLVTFNLLLSDGPCIIRTSFTTDRNHTNLRLAPLPFTRIDQVET